MTHETPTTNTTKTAKPRRWFRFRLRTLLVMVTLVSAPLGWVGWELDQRRREKATIAWVREIGGEVYFLSLSVYVGNDLLSDERNWWEKAKDNWFGERVRYVAFHNNLVRDLSPLAELKTLEYLDLSHAKVTDLSPLAKVKSLKTLKLDGGRILVLMSKGQGERLRLALPNCDIRY